MEPIQDRRGVDLVDSMLLQEGAKSIVSPNAPWASKVSQPHTDGRSRRAFVEFLSRRVSSFKK
jgi:hypothetical protein